MRRLLATVLAIACVVGSTPVFARGSDSGMGRGTGGAATGSSNQLLALPSAPPPAMQNRIPGPLALPAQAPIINGPISQPDFRGMTGMGQ
jgi:hypothetical protein